MTKSLLAISPKPQRKEGKSMRFSSIAQTIIYKFIQDNFVMEAIEVTQVNSMTLRVTDHKGDHLDFIYNGKEVIPVYEEEVWK